jgi:hypothetical protein
MAEGQRGVPTASPERNMAHMGERLARRSAFAIGAGCVVLIAAVRSPLFNASLTSPAVSRGLAVEYLAVDQQFGGLTNPYSLDALLDHLMVTAPTTMALETAHPGTIVTRAVDGRNDAQAAEKAVLALGATAELAPVRRQLIQCYRDVEQAWQQEGRVEQAFSGDQATGAPSIFDLPPSVHAAAAASISTIHQAQALHDAAMAAVVVLTHGQTP